MQLGLIEALLFSFCKRLRISDSVMLEDSPNEEVTTPVSNRVAMTFDASCSKLIVC